MKGRREHGAPARRRATAGTAGLLADLVVGGVRTVAFVRSTWAAEAVAMLARNASHRSAPSWRAGCPPTGRVTWPSSDASWRHRGSAGDQLGVAATSALGLVGFAERGFDAAEVWLSATREAVASCASPGRLPLMRAEPRMRE